jgi:hypothetical protein
VSLAAVGHPSGATPRDVHGPRCTQRPVEQREPLGRLP